MVNSIARASKMKKGKVLVWHSQDIQKGTLGKAIVRMNMLHEFHIDSLNVRVLIRARRRRCACNCPFLAVATGTK